MARNLSKKIMNIDVNNMYTDYVSIQQAMYNFRSSEENIIKILKENNLNFVEYNNNIFILNEDYDKLQKIYYGTRNSAEIVIGDNDEASVMNRQFEENLAESRNEKQGNYLEKDKSFVNSEEDLPMYEQLDMLNEEYNSLFSKYNLLTDKYNKYKTNYEALAVENKKTIEELNSLSKDREEILSDKSKIAIELIKLKSSYIKIEKENESLSNNLNLMTCFRDNLLRENKSIETKNEELRKELKEMTVNYNKSAYLNKKFKDDLDISEKKNNELIENLEKLLSSKNELIGVTKAQQERLKKLENKFVIINDNNVQGLNAAGSQLNNILSQVNYILNINKELLKEADDRKFRIVKFISKILNYFGIERDKKEEEVED